MEDLNIRGIVKYTPTDEDISEVEIKTEIVFPPSYKKFVKKLGAGETCNLFVVYIPHSSNEHCDFERQNKNDKETIQDNMDFWERTLRENSKTREWLSSLEPFGDSLNGDILAWDVNAKKAGEYPIYLLEHENTKFPLVAHSLDEFINEFCLNQKIDELFPRGQNERWELPNTFVPY